MPGGGLVAGGHPPEVEREGRGEDEEDEREGCGAGTLEAEEPGEDRRDDPLHHKQAERQRQQHPNPNGHDASHGGNSSSRRACPRRMGAVPRRACRVYLCVVPSCLVKQRAARTLTRRDFLKLTGTGFAGATLLGAAGCGLTERIRNIRGSRPTLKEGTNVVLVIIDSLRKDHIGAYGNPDDPKPQPRRPRQGQPDLYPGLPRVHTDHLRAESHSHGLQDLALQGLGASEGRGHHPAGVGSPSPSTRRRSRR